MSEGVRSNPGLVEGNALILRVAFFQVVFKAAPNTRPRRGRVIIDHEKNLLFIPGIEHGVGVLVCPAAII